MDPYFLLLAFILGTIIGSFLNVVAYRYNTGMGIGGRSKCMACARTLTWIELVPLASFIVQKGACRKCKSKISWQYPLVEFLAGALFVLIFMKFPPLSFAAGLMTFVQLVMAGLLIVIVVYDIKHKVIPNALVYAFAVVAFLSIFLNPAGVIAGAATVVSSAVAFATPLFHLPALGDLLAGPLLALPFALLWFVSRGRWMGLGDAKIMLGIGWVLGLNAGLSAIFLAFWIGAAISIIWVLIAYHRIEGRREIPFAPYLVLGMYLVLLFGISVIDINPFLGILSR
jgi:prepilin signal peptidase PulO-like enzyme (type II secretory pathway)